LRLYLGCKTDMSDPPSTADLVKERVIVALDRASADANLALVDQLADRIGWYKVGLRLFVAAGPPLVERLLARGRRVFLDLKYHDIPNTVAGAVESAASLGVELLTVHAAGGRDMLEAAARAAAGVHVAGGAPRPRIIAVTVLTSQAGERVSEQVVALARRAVESGCDGVVCSAWEAAAVRAACGEACLIVTPGIRFGQAAEDQARVATPAEALRAGADYLVVGRPVYRAADPVAALTALGRALAGGDG
jgi:orotidine-5'-phosphate decarboxylase